MRPDPPQKPTKRDGPLCRTCREQPARALPELGIFGRYRRFCSVRCAAIYGVYCALRSNHGKHAGDL